MQEMAERSDPVKKTSCIFLPSNFYPSKFLGLLSNLPNLPRVRMTLQLFIATSFNQGPFLFSSDNSKCSRWIFRGFSKTLDYNEWQL